MKTNAGILVYRHNQEKIEFLLLKPGGPFYKNLDNGSWTIPKGKPEDGESKEETALREFTEETGFTVNDRLSYLGLFKTSQQKSTEVFISCSNFNPVDLVSNEFEIEFPKNSGNIHRFPEIEKGEWFNFEQALVKIMPRQKTILKNAYNVIMNQ